ncbi:MAG: 4-hydroxy-tetrahydrodipicolinate reductase [Idiomarina sp.]|nr:4-hydroxy-tetrahydrodipicolinate reductase [Idiomarina sp.]
MGREVVRALVKQNLALVAALVRPDSAHLSTNVGLAAGVDGLDLSFTADLSVLTQADVVIDFALPEGIEARLQAYQDMSVPAVICTTGLSTEQLQLIEHSSQTVAMLHAANTSMGINLLQLLVEQSARALGIAADIEILEAHHTAKKDAPSGTALALGEAAARGRGQQLDQVAALNRNAPGHLHTEGSIGFATIRAGDIVGEHTVFLVTGGERLELTHRVSSRSTFAEGAARAACWLAQKQPGFYQMRDVLGVDL